MSPSECRLPTYKRRSQRYHPYRYPIATDDDSFTTREAEAAELRFVNTIYDDEAVFLEVPVGIQRTAEQQEQARMRLPQIVETVQRLRRIGPAKLARFENGLARASLTKRA